MTEEHIKEAISLSFMRLIANRQGFTADKPEQDYGCDLVLRQVSHSNRNGRKRHLQSGKQLELQLKCTTEKQIAYDNGSLKYDLETKTFNDLVEKRNSFISPLLLILMILPDDPSSWLTVSSTELVIRKAAYWYLPAAGTAFSDNATTTRITIPTINLVGPSFVDDRIAEVYQ